MTAINVLSGLVVMTLKVQSPIEVQNFFQITNCHLFHPLLHLVANVISELEMHEDMLYPWRGKCDSNQCSWWSSGYDACLDSERPGFNPPWRCAIFSDR